MTARRDCFTDASATRRQRSRRPPRVERRDGHLGSRGDDRLDGGDAKHDGIPHDVVHLVAFQDGLHERERNRRLGGRLDTRQQLHAHVAPLRGDDLREEFQSAAVEDRDRVARPKPQHPRQVLRLVFRQQHRLVAGIQRRARRIGAQRDYTRCRVTCMREFECFDTCTSLIACCYTRRAMFFRGQIIGKYKILSTIGSGGFGTVYLAEDTWIDKKVALKVPHKQGVDFGELLREPRLLASLNHPNIVTILTAEKQENVFFIVMEFVPGETLEAIIARDGALELSRALDYTCQICNAVDHAHRHGVLHRDLRPANVLVAESGMLKVADFGTSRFLEIAAHGTTVIGSPPYMAPEQFHGKAVFASDLYSLGVTMYQMMTGVLPYDTPSPADLDRLMRGELVTAPRLKNPKIPSAISDIVVKAMAPEIHARYQRAGDLLDDVLAARGAAATRMPRSTPGGEPASAASDDVQDIHNRLKAREAPQPRFCWHCRKPLHARSDRCPFCGEAQRAR